MDRRKLADGVPEVGRIGFGGNVFGWTLDAPTSYAVLDAFVGAGFNLIDTADIYSTWVPGNKGGESEAIIGNWLSRGAKRDQVVIATKVGGEMGPQRQGLSRSHIVKSVEDSLRRLRTDYIDLYQSHVDDPQVPLEETLETYGRLIEQGKVRAIGASNFTADRLRDSLQTSDRSGLPRYRSVQERYNLYDRSEFEAGMEPLCLEEGVAVLTYSSLASGFLTGKYRGADDLAKSQRGGGIGKYMDERGMSILQEMDRISAERGASPAQVALAWLLARPSVTAVLASATSVEQLDELAQGAQLTLDSQAMEALDAVSASDAGASAR